MDLPNCLLNRFRADFTGFQGFFKIWAGFSEIWRGFLQFWSFLYFKLQINRSPCSETVERVDWSHWTHIKIPPQAFVLFLKIWRGFLLFWSFLYSKLQIEFSIFKRSSTGDWSRWKISMQVFLFFLKIIWYSPILVFFLQVKTLIEIHVSCRASGLKKLFHWFFTTRDNSIWHNTLFDLNSFLT